MKEFIGLNGHTVQFKPDLYRPVARLVRDYHPVEWDLGAKTSEPAPFPFAKNRVDWSQVYGSWKEKGWTTDACLMFETIPLEDWNNLEKEARAYGEDFAREFGPDGERKLVESVEIGNEPGKWKDADYRRVFRAMASGIRAGDPKMKVATCNLTTGPGGAYEKSVACLGGMDHLIDVLTVHTYAQLTGWPTWRRSFPEDPALPNYLQDVEDLCAWRDRHLPGKPVWITEFGYDCTTQPQEKSGTFSKWEGVSDKQQAQWIVRSLLVFSAMPVERAYIYFFNDDDKAQLHAGAGLTRNFQPKPSFHAVSHLQKTLGDYHFERMVSNEAGKIRIQEYRHGGNPKKIIWAVWSPTGGNASHLATLKGLPGRLSSSANMPLGDERSEVEVAANSEKTEIKMIVTESPTFLQFDE